MSEKNQIAPIGPDDPKTEASLDEKKPSADRRQFITGVASAIGAGVILNAAASSAVGQTAIGSRQIISFKLTKDDLASIGEVVTRLQVTTSGVDPSQPGAFTIRNHNLNSFLRECFGQSCALIINSITLESALKQQNVSSLSRVSPLSRKSQSGSCPTKFDNLLKLTLTRPKTDSFGLYKPQDWRH